MYPHLPAARVFVWCPSYHGATLLAVLLNAHPAVVHLGDTNPTTKFDQPCSCGDTVSACAFWQGLRSNLDLEEYTGLPQWFPEVPPFTPHERTNVVLTYGFALVDRLTGREIDGMLSSRVRQFRETHDRLADLARAAAGATVFVDGEKLVDKSVLLAANRRSTRVLHLVRDPRGFVFSNLRRGREDIVEWAGRWRRYHARVRLASRLLGPQNVLTIRYEDLADDTSATMRRVFEFIGVPEIDLDSALSTSSRGHIIGNRMLTTFEGDVSIDRRWQDGLSPDQARDILRESGSYATELGYE